MKTYLIPLLQLLPLIILMAWLISKQILKYINKDQCQN